MLASDVVNANGRAPGGRRSDTSEPRVLLVTSVSKNQRIWRRRLVEPGPLGLLRRQP